MESQNFTPSSLHSDSSSRPSLGFPLGTAFLLIVIFSLSGILSCCYHRDKLRSFRRGSQPSDLEAASTDTMKPKPILSSLNQMEKECLPVLMPGDQVPKFIAMPCPCQPPRSNDVVTVEVQKSTKLPPHVVLS
ncbi:hypothetical protein Leryth_015470 [Lithospermum erythrorhizon]|nr:hypothetical protein Leryth_015470 [Lithospermum erythrorhizon]